uniref:Uncharacterized protein n=1 Tax=Mantoniella antarctica TaxID=81844 RepID=A0A7S0S7G9_9CHLO
MPFNSLRADLVSPIEMRTSFEDDDDDDPRAYPATAVAIALSPPPIVAPGSSLMRLREIDGVVGSSDLSSDVRGDRENDVNPSAPPPKGVLHRMAAKIEKRRKLSSGWMKRRTHLLSLLGAEEGVANRAAFGARRVIVIVLVTCTRPRAT